MANTYSAAHLKISISGVNISGFGETDVVNITRDENKFVKSTGADGRTSRSHNESDSGVIEITLHQTSGANDLLSAWHATDVATLNGELSIVIEDLNGTSKFVAEDAWIQKPAETGFGKEFTDRVWTIDCGELTMFVGGNESSTLNTALSYLSTAAGVIS